MSKPINICGSSDNFNPKKTEYIYKIELIFNDLTKKEIVKISDSKYVKLFSFDKDINFETIKSFYIIVENINECINYSLSSNFNFKKNINFNTYKNTNLYLEFRKNYENKTACNCYITAFDNNRIFVTPPNY